MLGIADGVRQFDFREIMSVKTLNKTLVGSGDGFLRLHHFQVVSNSRGEPVLGLGERLFGRRIDYVLRHAHCRVMVVAEPVVR